MQPPNFANGCPVDLQRANLSFLRVLLSDNTAALADAVVSIGGFFLISFCSDVPFCFGSDDPHRLLINPPSFLQWSFMEVNDILIQQQLLPAERTAFVVVFLLREVKDTNALPVSTTILRRPKRIRFKVQLQQQHHHPHQHRPQLEQPGEQQPHPPRNSGR